MHAQLMRKDFCAFNHRSFLKLNPGIPLQTNRHLEVLAAKLEEVKQGARKRLIINVPPATSNSDTTSIAFPAWILVS